MIGFYADSGKFDVLYSDAAIGFWHPGPPISLTQSVTHPTLLVSLMCMVDWLRKLNLSKDLLNSLSQLVFFKWLIHSISWTRRVCLSVCLSVARFNVPRRLISLTHCAEPFTAQRWFDSGLWLHVWRSAKDVIKWEVDYRHVRALVQTRCNGGRNFICWKKQFLLVAKADKATK